MSDAYSIFVTNFTEAVNVDLYAPNVTGIANNLPMFTQQLQQELTTLEQSVVKSLGHQPARRARGHPAPSGDHGLQREQPEEPAKLAS